jgi:hypothetical protein
MLEPLTVKDRAVDAAPEHADMAVKVEVLTVMTGLNTVIAEVA